MNVLFVTLDQFRGDSYAAAGHPLVQTPTLDRIAREGVRLSRHYSQAAPCSPGRAAIYTGTYQMNNRVVANGTPLPKGLDNIAHVARRAGYDPTLFGYTDQGVDPANAEGIDDPRLDSYDGVLPGLSVGLYLPESQAGWIQHLRANGYDVPYGWEAAARGEPDRPAELSLSGFLTSRFLDWLGTQESGWFAHLSYLRPHPPYAAAGEFSRMYDPADIEMPIAPVPASQRHAIHDAAMGFEASAARTASWSVPPATGIAIFGGKGAICGAAATIGRGCRAGATGRTGTDGAGGFIGRISRSQSGGVTDGPRSEETQWCAAAKSPRRPEEPIDHLVFQRLGKRRGAEILQLRHTRRMGSNSVPHGAVGRAGRVDDGQLRR